MVEAEQADGKAVARRVEAIRGGDRRALARAITLIESRRADHRAEAAALVAALLPHAGGSLRIGLTGAPGVGKSTFIEAFGSLLTAAGERVAVLAVDPSSALTGGSILGDKTRMEKLARDPNAFIRPSPSETALGGVARRTREAIVAVEAAGYSVVVVETVGVGQSETEVAEMTDVFVLLMAPGGGDELQGVKRGVMEMADLVLVNKADGALAETAGRTAADYAGALGLLRRRQGDPDGIPKAATVSSVSGAGLEAAWEEIRKLDAWRRAEGWRDRRRAEQASRWMRREIERGLMSAFDADAAAQTALKDLEREVAEGRLTPELAADRALAAFRG